MVPYHTIAYSYQVHVVCDTWCMFMFYINMVLYEGNKGIGIKSRILMQILKINNQ